MDIRTAVDKLILEAAGEHIDPATAEFLHRFEVCDVCEALEVARVFCQTLPDRDFQTGEPVLVGVAQGRVSHVETRVHVNLDDIGVVSCLPVTVRRDSRP